MVLKVRDPLRSRTNEGSLRRQTARYKERSKPFVAVKLNDGFYLSESGTVHYVSGERIERVERITNEAAPALGARPPALQSVQLTDEKIRRLNLATAGRSCELAAIAKLRAGDVEGVLDLLTVAWQAELNGWRLSLSGTPSYRLYDLYALICAKHDKSRLSVLVDRLKQELEPDQAGSQRP